MNIEQRVELGKRVRDTLDFLGQQSPEFWQEFANEMKRRDLLQTATDHQPDFEMMNTEQAMKFEETIMPFGVNNGSKIKDISLSYLINITEPNDFTKKLRRYIRYRQRRT